MKARADRTRETGESSSEAQKENMLTRAWQALFRSSSSLFPSSSAEDQADTQDADAQLEEETADSEADARSTENGKGDLFRSDPQYETNYDAQKQVDVYGAKTAVEPPRPLLELGREQYTSGYTVPEPVPSGRGIVSAAPGPRRFTATADGRCLQMTAM